MKCAMLQKWNNWICGGKHSFTKGGRNEEHCRWIVEAWDELDPELFVKSFLKCSRSNNLNYTQDNVLLESWATDDEDDDEQDDAMDEYYNDNDTCDFDA